MRRSVRQGCTATRQVEEDPVAMPCSRQRSSSSRGGCRRACAAQVAAKRNRLCRSGSRRGRRAR
eukprot:8138297-Alexandrium_andersonii.AAC.1